MVQESELIHVYFMPGMAANPSIFEHIRLPRDRFKIHLLEWILPKEDESLQSYALRMNKFIKYKNVVLIGVSFGGVVVQEMSKHLELKRLIIISSIKSPKELPRRMRYAASTGFFKLLPTGLISYADHLEKIAFGDYLQKRAKLYRKYLSVRDKRYLDWAIKNMLLWKQEHPPKGLIHIHGDSDEIFPYKYIHNCIRVKGGTHIMVINRYRWFNEHLPGIILNGRIEEEEKK